MSDAELQAIIQRARGFSQKKSKNTNLTADADPAHDVTTNTVTKSHALSRAYYRFSITEKRCMEALISKLHPLRGDNQPELELTAAEYAAAYGVNQKTAYRDISTAVDALMHRVVTADRLNGNPGKRQLNIMDSAEYMSDEGKIVCCFTKSATPHLIGLREKFSSYPLRDAVNFSSSYTWRFYEILASWAQPKNQTQGRFTGWIQRQSVDELREMLGVPKSYKWFDFQRQVLDVVIRELRQKANIVVFTERVKTSRKITHLNISFIEDEQMPMKLKP